MRVSRSTGVVLSAVVLAILALGIYLFRVARINALRSCLAATNKALNERQILPRAETEISGNWLILSERDAASLLAGLDLRDCPRPVQRNSGAVLLDPWNQAVHVGVRRTSVGRMEFILWSTGPDNKSGTDDDIVSKYGERPPK